MIMAITLTHSDCHSECPSVIPIWVSACHMAVQVIHPGILHTMIIILTMAMAIILTMVILTGDMIHIITGIIMVIMTGIITVTMAVGMYYPDHRPVYYGPRRSIETNRMAEATKTTAVNGRRVSTTGSGTSRVASGSNSSSGNRTLSSGNFNIRRSTENSVTKSTRSAGTGYTERRPYGTAGVNSRTSNSSSERQYSTGTPGSRTSETTRTMGSTAHRNALYIQGPAQPHRKADHLFRYFR